MSKRFTIGVELAPPEGMEDEELTRIISLAIQGVLAKHEVLATKIDVAAGKIAPKGSSFTNGKPGRKPINRPKVEAWIRKNVPIGDSTQGTSGLNGVDREGRPLIEAPNRVYPHRLAAPEPDGVGLSLLAIDKVLKELDVEGYLERGYAAGSPFYEYIKELHPEGYEGPGVEITRATVREVDFTNTPDARWENS